MTDDSTEDSDPTDSLDFTPEMATQGALRELSGKWKDNPPSKALLIYLWDDDANYGTSFFNAGLTTSQCVALLARMQYDFLKRLAGDEE